MISTTETKTTKSTRFLLLFLFAAITFLLVGCSNGEETNGEAEAGNEEVLVAANLPLSGDLATYGQPIQEGAQMALSDLNADSAKGSPINFDWKDNSGSTKDAVSVMKQQLLQSPDIYVSGVKPQTMAIEEQISNRGLPHFVWLFDMEINKSGKNNFRTWMNLNASVRSYSQYAEKIDPERVAIAFVDLPHSRKAYDQKLVSALKEQGVEKVRALPFTMKRRDFTNLAEKISNYNPDLIVLGAFASQFSGIIGALRPRGLIHDGNTIASLDMLDAAEALGPEQLEGIRVNTPMFTLRPDRKRVAKWRDRFEERYGSEPSYTAAFAYDMTQIIDDTADRLDLPASSEEWIQALGKTNMQGITGPLRFDESGSLVAPIGIGVYRDGELVPDTSVTVGTPEPVATTN